MDRGFDEEGLILQANRLHSLKLTFPNMHHFSIIPENSVFLIAAIFCLQRVTH